ncbi:MAG: adenosyl-hopene transferase HpnH [Pseudomonadota bacterium]
MPIPLKQLLRVGSYVVRQKLMRNKRFSMVLMLEPLFRCNLKCVGCGKIQQPREVLKKELTPGECFRAAKECGAPIVSIAGGEPLLHPRIGEIVDGFVSRKRFVYLCTNGILLEKNLHRFTPSDYFTISVHVDGMQRRHDELVALEGTFEKAISGIETAKALGFHLNTNTTVFEGESPEELADLFDFLTELGVDGLTVSPGYAYEHAPDREHFLQRERTQQFFMRLFEIGRQRGRKWPFNHSPFFLDFLEGKIDYDCTPWGNPNYSVLGWQAPCYLFAEGYARSFRELLEATDWKAYGRKSGHPGCTDCMMHCGYEPSAVADSTRNLAHTIRSIRSVLS